MITDNQEKLDRSDDDIKKKNPSDAGVMYKLMSKKSAKQVLDSMSISILNNNFIDNMV